VLIAATLLFGGLLYIRLRWHRAPQAYQAMIGVAGCYLLAGEMLGAWVFHLATPKPTEVTAAAIPTVSAPPARCGQRSE
jgi:hypothetical protein